MNKTMISLALFTALTSGAVFAEESEVIDPSDLTRVYTQAAFFVTSDADIRVSAMFTGAWTEDIQFAGFVEGNFGNNSAKEQGKDKFGLDYQKSRAQYFQVHAVDNKFMPRVGLSTDLIHQSSNAGAMKNLGYQDTTLVSVGGIGLLNPAYTAGAMVFPNVAYTTGKVLGESADGYMVNLFVTQHIGDSGAFVQVWPEYFNVEGDTVEMESKSFNVMFNAPIKSDRTQWLMTKLEYGSTDITTPDGWTIDGDVELKAEIGVKWFF
ncbi:hypothetical protein [Vibrio methylphosphonaticus]|uniref:hypothetical protein n=1 Tax=Vibrio methylphosphonaticus TaxID=2946866 RepID=UPI00202AA530|nr:hypothetical protein [Vibrio methylphosphonaticus]MCL9774009.1 hypothetical protein [Vibrio methylphosphonaticus]